MSAGSQKTTKLIAEANAIRAAAVSWVDHFPFFVRVQIVSAQDRNF
jgi:hypothetical protein